MLRISFFFFACSIGVGLWLGHELGIFGHTPTVAGEPARDGEGIESLHRAVEARGKELDAKEAELARRERTITDKETVFSQQLERYEKIIAEQKAELTKLRALSAQQVDGYRKIYEKMDAKKVAQIFEGMDTDLVGEIIGAMRPQISVEILAKMPANKVRLLTSRYLTKRIPASRKVNDEPEAQ